MASFLNNSLLEHLSTAMPLSQHLVIFHSFIFTNCHLHPSSDQVVMKDICIIPKLGLLLPPNCSMVILQVPAGMLGPADHHSLHLLPFQTTQNFHSTISLLKTFMIINSIQNNPTPLHFPRNLPYHLPTPWTFSSEGKLWKKEKEKYEVHLS